MTRALLAALALVACQAPLADAPCPCAIGYVCCDSRRTCVESGDTCPASPAGDGATDPAGDGATDPADDGAGQGGETIDPDGEHHGYAISRITLPGDVGEALALAFDLGGSASPDNAFGDTLLALASLGIDVSAAVEASLATGQVIHLVDVQATSLTGATGVGVRLLYGKDPEPRACAPGQAVSVATCGRHLLGDAGMYVARDEPESQMVGEIEDGVFAGGGESLHVTLAIGQELIPLPLAGARLSLPLAPGELGKLGGGIPIEMIEATVVPALVRAIGDRVEASCGGPPGACCASGGAGAQLLAVLDDNGDCVVSVTELSADPVIAATLLDPDLDLFAGGTFAPDADGVADSLSLGIGLTLARAIFHDHWPHRPSGTEECSDCHVAPW